MKRVYTFIMLLAMSSATFVGCSKNTSKGILGGANVGGTVVKTVATVVGLILLSKLLKSVLKTVTGGTSAFAGLSQDKNFITSFNEDTRLNSFAQNEVMKTALQALVAQHYQIPFAKVAGSYNNLVTVGDLATFIGENASAKVLTEIK